MAMIEALSKVIKRLHYPIEVMLVCVRWYAAYPLSLRHIEEIMGERGVVVDHATTPLFIAGRSRSCQSLLRCFADARGRLVESGVESRCGAVAGRSEHRCCRPFRLAVP